MNLIQDCVVSTFSMLQEGKACMQNDLDLVLAEHSEYPNYGNDGKAFVFSLRKMSEIAEVVRKELLSKKTHFQLAQETDTIPAQKVETFFKIVIELQETLKQA